MSDLNAHAWYVRRLELLRAGLLDETDERLLQAHLADCAACRDTLSTADESRGATGEHVPSALLARWPAAGELLPALERELIERHLARCAACREDLAIALATRAAPEAAEVIALPRRARPVRAAWLAAAAAAVVVAALVPAALRHAPQPAMSPAGAQALAIDVRAGANGVRLRDVTRGAAASDTAIRLGPRDVLALVVEPPDVPDATPVTLELVRSDDAVVARAERVQRELYPARHLALGDARAPVPEGRWRLRVIARPEGASPDTLSWAFELSRAR